MIEEFRKANFSVDSEFFRSITTVGTVDDTGTSSEWMSKKDRLL